MEYFASSSHSVSSQRILYTPSEFARTSLLYLQETGSLHALAAHTSHREHLASYLFFSVTSGSGELNYNGKTYALHSGDCVFIDCRKPYSHATSADLWTLQWCHFYGHTMPDIYKKYQERGGQPVFHPKEMEELVEVMTDLYSAAGSDSYVRDMKINEILNRLLWILMKNSWHSEQGRAAHARKRMSMEKVKSYLDENYKEHITLELLSQKFYINKYYLTKIFKETYGVTIISYLETRRITQAKNLLRFTDMTVDEISAAIGMNDANYLARRFRKIEGMSPGEYRKKW